METTMMGERTEANETSQWLMLSLELWLVIALGLAVGATGTLLFARVVALEQRVATLEMTMDLGSHD
jgi:hypothetical protein